MPSLPLLSLLFCFYGTVISCYLAPFFLLFYLFAREYRNKEDPYLETREKEDAFLERVETAIRNGVKESVPMAMAKNLFEMLAPFVKESAGEKELSDLTEEKESEQHTEDITDWEQEADLDAALDFADSF